MQASLGEGAGGRGEVFRSPATGGFRAALQPAMWFCAHPLHTPRLPTEALMQEAEAQEEEGGFELVAARLTAVPGVALLAAKPSRPSEFEASVGEGGAVPPPFSLFFVFCCWSLCGWLTRCPQVRGQQACQEVIMCKIGWRGSHAPCWREGGALVGGMSVVPLAQQPARPRGCGLLPGKALVRAHPGTAPPCMWTRQQPLHAGPRRCGGAQELR